MRSNCILTPIPFADSVTGSRQLLSQDASASQSSLSEWSCEGEAQRALHVEGAGGWAFHTDREMRPWFKADLRADAFIEEVEVFNRLDSPTSHMRGMHIDIAVSRDDRVYETVHRTSAVLRDLAPGGSIRVTVLKRARYVRIMLREHGILHLDKVYIRGRKTLLDDEKIKFLDLYSEINNQFSEQFIFTLASRGFFSEVNFLIYAILYCLLNKKKLIISQAYFQDLNWNMFFDSTLLYDYHADAVDPDATVVNAGGGLDHNFQVLRGYMNGLHNNHTPIWIPELGLSGTVFQACSKIAKVLFSPRSEIVTDSKVAEQALFNGHAYDAIHVRRGDKVNGYEYGGSLVVEGEVIAPEQFAAALGITRDRPAEVFVMTDDASVLKEFAMIPGAHLSTLADSSDTGYDQATFNVKLRVDKANAT